MLEYAWSWRGSFTICNKIEKICKKNSKKTNIYIWIKRIFNVPFLVAKTSRAILWLHPSFVTIGFYSTTNWTNLSYFESMQILPKKCGAGNSVNENKYNLRFNVVTCGSFWTRTHIALLENLKMKEFLINYLYLIELWEWFFRGIRYSTVYQSYNKIILIFFI